MPPDEKQPSAPSEDQPDESQPTVRVPVKDPTQTDLIEEPED